MRLEKSCSQLKVMSSPLGSNIMSMLVLYSPCRGITLDTSCICFFKHYHKTNFITSQLVESAPLLINCTPRTAKPPFPTTSTFTFTWCPTSSSGDKTFKRHVKFKGGGEKRQGRNTDTVWGLIR